MNFDLRSSMGAEMVEEGGRLGRVGVRVEERMAWRGRFGVVGSVMSSAARLDILSWSHDGPVLVWEVVVGMIGRWLDKWAGNFAAIFLSLKFTDKTST